MQGLKDGNIKEIHWADVAGWVSQGGAFLGTNRTLPTPETLPLMAEQIKKNNINGLLVVGGFEAFQAVLMLTENRDKFNAFCIPILCIPATISKFYG